MVELNHAFGNVNCPYWLNPNGFCAAMRMTGFVTSGGVDGMVIEALDTHYSVGTVDIMAYRYGFGMAAGAVWDAGREVLGYDAVRSLRETGEPVTCTLPNGIVELRPAPHPDFGDDLGTVENAMVALVADEAGRARTFRTPDQLKEALDLPSAARPLFVLDAWDHPEMDLRPSEAVDFILAVAALRERRAITTSVTEKAGRRASGRRSPSWVRWVSPRSGDGVRGRHGNEDQGGRPRSSRRPVGRSPGRCPWSARAPARAMPASMAGHPLDRG